MLNKIRFYEKLQILLLPKANIFVKYYYNPTSFGDKTTFPVLSFGLPAYYY